MKIEFDERSPIYLQIVNELKAKIAVGRINCRERLPSVREMAKEYGVNPNTMQRVYHRLERDGVCFSNRGTGTFVRDDKSLVTRLRQEMADRLVGNFLLDMEKIGLSGEEIEHAVTTALRRTSRITNTRPMIRSLRETGKN
ncbi:MAG: GntR family transcriptional regulator [Bacillota bacterium]